MSGPNVRAYNNKEELLFPASIGEYLPKDSLARFVDDAVEAMDMSVFYEKVASEGNPSYNPEMMLKVIMYGYSQGITSSRKIEEKTQTDIGFIFLAGMQKPDHKTINEFRRRHKAELIKRVLATVKIGREVGMVKFGIISIDSKVMKANASSSRTLHSEEINEAAINQSISEYMREADETDKAEDEKYGADKRGDELPEAMRDAKTRKAKIREALRAIESEKQKEKGTERKITDSDARFQEGKGKQQISGYRAQIAVDAESQIIVASEVTNEQNDYNQLIPMIEETKKNMKEIEKETAGTESEKEETKMKVLADCGYSSGPVLSKLENEKHKATVEVYMPDKIYQERENGKGISEYDKDNFKYNKEKDEYECPCGKRLKYKQTKRANSKAEQYVRVYQCQDCARCEKRTDCTTSSKGRIIKVSENDNLYKAMRKKLRTAAGRAIYGMRKTSVEPVIGNMSYNIGYTEFSLRGIDKVTAEYALMCAGHNIRKIWLYVRRLGMGLREVIESKTRTQSTAIA